MDEKTQASFDASLAEFEQFEKSLPELMRRIPGRWVVFAEGRVHSEHDSEDAALTVAYEAFGLGGVFVVARVEPTRTVSPSGYHSIFGQAAV